LNLRVCRVADHHAGRFEVVIPHALLADDIALREFCRVSVLSNITAWAALSPTVRISGC
jgi:hypothetical protein